MKIVRKSVLLFLVSIALPITMLAQEQDKEAIENVITTLFDGMRAGDSSMVSSTFLNDAIMHSVFTNREGEVVRNVGSLEGFLNAIGTPKEDIWDEQIASVEIKLDGDLASVWTPYKFFVSDNFSHCGVNSFQMMKKDGEWKILYIVDTRRRDNCIE